jgi:hypothetical protein
MGSPQKNGGTEGAEMVAGRRAKNTPVLHGTHPIRWRQPELVLKRQKWTLFLLLQQFQRGRSGHLQVI